MTVSLGSIATSHSSMSPPWQVPTPVITTSFGSFNFVGISNSNEHQLEEQKSWLYLRCQTSMSAPLASCQPMICCWSHHITKDNLGLRPPCEYSIRGVASILGDARCAISRIKRSKVFLVLQPAIISRHCLVSDFGKFLSLLMMCWLLALTQPF